MSEPFDLTGIDEAAAVFDIFGEGLGNIMRAAARSTLCAMMPLALGAASGAVDELEYFEGIAP